ncbi:transglutaminase family protein [soil metagenome]
MILRVGFDMAFELEAPVAMQLLLRLHPSRLADLRSPERLVVEPQPLTWAGPFIDAFGNRGDLLLAPAGRFRIHSDMVVHDDGQPDPVRAHIGQVPVENLVPFELPFLLPSRYCEVERLGDVAWDRFGAVSPGWPRVQAICDWVHERTTYGYEHAGSTLTAMDALERRAGVCRDFQHLAISMCRCLNIPARYVSGWLGDIGVAPSGNPMDLHAWFEVRLDGGWYPFDAQHNTPRVGRVVMARGRDAADVAFTTAFGTAPLAAFEVWAEQVDEVAVSSS